MVGPSGTKMCLAVAKTLLHDVQEEQDLFGEGGDLEDT